MQIDHYLIIHSYQRNYGAHSSGDYTATLEGTHLIAPGSTVPCIIDGQKCIGLAKIRELRLQEEITVVQFDLINLDEKTEKALYKLCVISTGKGGDANAPRVDSDTARTGMSAAARLMMGEDRSPREIARGKRRQKDDDDEDGIWEMMRRSNPGDSFFDDD